KVLYTDYSIRSPQIFYEGGNLHFVFYAGDTLYEIYYVRVSLEEELPIISLTFGGDTLQPGTVYRRGYISYGEEYYKNVDYGDSLIYEIPLVSSGLFKIRFEGFADEDIKEKIYVNRTPLGNWHIDKGVYSYYEKRLPRSAVSDILRVKIEKKRGGKAILGALKIYVLRESGGAQGEFEGANLDFDIRLNTLLKRNSLLVFMPYDGEVEIKVYDVSGRSVYSLREFFESGIQS
ncbi:MAG: hypothetical protein ABDH49_09250, partial [Candidatus Hydrothermales bacterium]